MKRRRWEQWNARQTRYRMILHHSWSDKPDGKGAATTAHYPESDEENNEKRMGALLEKLVTENTSITGGHIEQRILTIDDYRVWAVCCD